MEDKVEEDLARIESRIRSSRIGCFVFPAIYLVASVVFMYVFLVNRGVQNIVLSVVLLFLAGASIHGYRWRIANLRMEADDLRKRIGGDSI